MSIQEYVYQALEEEPLTRSDDSLLIYQVFRRYAADNDIPPEEVNVAARALGLFPSVRTIVRARAAIQREHPELTDKQIAEERAALGELYREEFAPDSYDTLVDPDLLGLDLGSFDFFDDSDIVELDFSDFDPDQLTF